MYRLKFGLQQVFVLRNEAVGVIQHAASIMLHAKGQAPLRNKNETAHPFLNRSCPHLVDFDPVGCTFDAPSGTRILNPFEVLDEHAILLPLLAFVFGFTPAHVFKSPEDPPCSVEQRHSCFVVDKIDTFEAQAFATVFFLLGLEHSIDEQGVKLFIGVVDAELQQDESRVGLTNRCTRTKRQTERCTHARAHTHTHTHTCSKVLCVKSSNPNMSRILMVQLALLVNSPLLTCDHGDAMVADDM